MLSIIADALLSIFSIDYRLFYTILFALQYFLYNTDILVHPNEK